MRKYSRNVLNINNFRNYFKHLVDYQNQVLPDNKLSKDYIILYDYLMDLLEKDDLVGELLVRKKLQMSSINADVLLDLRKLFDIHSYVYEPFVCLALNGRDNEHFLKAPPHPFYNAKFSVVPRNIKNAVWLALQKGLSMNGGSFVRGYQGDIYEINLTSSERYESSVRLNAFSSDINFNINFRILINYSRHPSKDSSIFKPYSPNEFNKQWFAVLPRHIKSPFEISLPQLEYKMKQTNFNLVMIMRVFRFLFEKHEKLYTLHIGFLESIIYSEYMELIHGSEKSSQQYDYIFKGVFARLYNALKTRKHPCFWNERLNLMKPFDKNFSFSNVFDDLNILYDQFNNLRNKNALEYADFFEFFDFEMEPFSYEVDQFGIFKSY